ncbi:MAG TPA: Flp family type IVb pilin [Jiangellaceae bacterium]
MQFILFTLINLRSRVEDLKQRERGATAVEYGLLVALIAVAIMITVGLIGDELNTLFNEVLDALEAA